MAEWTDEMRAKVVADYVDAGLEEKARKLEEEYDKLSAYSRELSEEYANVQQAIKDLEKMTQVTARIENWIVVGGKVYGKIYEDSRGRWNDGHGVYLSRGKAGESPIEGELYETRNSLYMMGKPAVSQY